MLLFFFFKQKTAYEMRISDWSSDVCSSDLASCNAKNGDGRYSNCRTPYLYRVRREPGIGPLNGREPRRHSRLSSAPRASRAAVRAWCPAWAVRSPARSEEHTSELQSLMRISYAVFCLKKQNKTRQNTHNDTTHT